MLGCGREYEARKTANMLASTQACEAAEEECEAVLEREQSGTLPSTGDPPPAGLLPASKGVRTGLWALKRRQSGALASQRSCTKQEEGMQSLREALVPQPCPQPLDSSGPAD